MKIEHKKWVVECVENENIVLFKYERYEEEDFDVFKFYNGEWVYYDNVGKASFEEAVKLNRSYAEMAKS